MYIKNIDSIRNTTYQANHSTISSYVYNFILENRKFPTVMNIHTDTGLSRKTVYKHLSDSEYRSKFHQLTSCMHKFMRDSAIETLYYIGVQERNVSALKHYLELTGDSNDRSNSSVTNYIQINNLKVSREEFMCLPKETIDKIELIILEGKSGEKPEENLRKTWSKTL